MKDLLRRVLHRATGALLRPLEDQARAQQRDLIARLERLEKRMDSALAKGQADARLLAARIDAGGSRPPRRLGARVAIPASSVSSGTNPVDTVDKSLRGDPAPTPVPPDLIELGACSVCGHGEWTPVCEYNRFLLSGQAPDAAAARADYALCHRCGVVFARRRPVGARFRVLLEQFEETIGRASDDGQRGPKVLGSRRLSDADLEELKARAAHPVFVSEFPRVHDRRHLPQLLRDRLAAAPHIEILSSLLSLTAPRVLEIRPRFGAIGGALRRLYGGETMALPLFEVQQILVREVYGTRADHLLDYDTFGIPYEGCFDLVIANHLLTHAVHPSDALAEIRQRLTPGGHLYLYNEPDEADFLDSGKSIFNTLNAFHLQTFDGASLARALQSAGFEPVFIGHCDDDCIALARVPGPAAWEPIPTKERIRRVARYAKARDRSILMLPEPLRDRFASEWDAVVERAFAARLIDFDGDGQLRMVKQ